MSKIYTAAAWVRTMNWYQCRRRADWDIPAQSRPWPITAQTNKYTKSTYWSGLGHHDKASTATHSSDHWLLTGGCHWSCGGSVSVTHVWQAIDEGAVRYSSSGLLRDVSSTLESQQQNPVNSYFPVFIVTWVWPRSHRKRKLSLGSFTKTPPTTPRAILQEFGGVIWTLGTDINNYVLCIVLW